MAQAIKGAHAAKNTGAQSKAPKAAKDKLPFGKRYAVQVSKLGSKFEKAIKKVVALDDSTHASIGGIKKIIVDMTEAFKLVQQSLNALPDTFSPKGEKSSAGGPVAAGSTVALREKKRAEYDGLIDLKELELMTVKQVKGTKVCVTLKNGTSIFMPKSHVVVVKSTEGEAKAA